MSTENDSKPPAEPAASEQARPAVATSTPPHIRTKWDGMRFVRYGLIGLVAIAAIVLGAGEVISRMTHIYEYDARVVTDHVTISSRVDGVLRDLKVDTGDVVTAGAALAQMDDRVPALELRALQAELAALQTERSQYIARSSMVTQQTDSRYKTRLTSIRAERARRGALVAELRLARQEYTRFKSLFDKRVIARSRLDRAESEVSRLASDVRRADAEIASSRGQAQEAQADKAELSVIEQEAALVDFKEAMLRARIARHEALLSYRTIQTPKAGVIDRVFVEEGEFLGEGRRVLMLHDPENTWVEANIKETQVRRLKVGQRVAIDVDAYPDDKFIGRVAKIGGAATSSFALLPTPNPSGNFTKVTQRIPVKITFEQRPRPLAPGMMVEVEIDTRDDG
jgi:membrane fusion protein (multidrug efflux system)